MSDAHAEHLSDLQIAQYLDRRASASTRDDIERHLADCADCRRNVSESQQLLRHVRRPRRFVAAGTLLAAAAAVMIVVGVSKVNERSQPRFRGAPAEAGLIAYGPIGEPRRSDLRFVWSAAPNAASYRLSVSQVDGARIWSVSGTDTTAVPPGSVNLQPGTHYLWVVDALLLDGTSRSTGLREFTLGE
jgi:hypothetical protein